LEEEGRIERKETEKKTCRGDIAEKINLKEGEGEAYDAARGGGHSKLGREKEDWS